MLLMPMSLRQRNKHNAMRVTQRAALDLFEARGFDNVTVNEIADAAGVAASTVYRHFATKEAIVLWDEHDADLESAFDQELRRERPLQAIRSVFVGELANRYDEDLDFQLRRVRYIYATEQLHEAAAQVDLHDAAKLTEGLIHVLPKGQRSEARVLAGAAMLALDVAFDRWQQSNGVEPLGELIGQVFDTLGHLDALG